MYKHTYTYVCMYICTYTNPSTYHPHLTPQPPPTPTLPKTKSFAHLAAGLACGLSSLAAGIAIGVVGDAGVRAVGQQERLFVGMILILIFAEALGTCVCFCFLGVWCFFWGRRSISIFLSSLSSHTPDNNPDTNHITGLYGLIVSLILSQKNVYCGAA